MQDAKSDPRKHGYLSYKDNDSRGVSCLSSTGEYLIKIEGKGMKWYDATHYPDELQSTIVHEVKHTCGQNHDPIFHDYLDSKIKREFEKDIEKYVNGREQSSLKDFLRDIIYNPYYFDYILQVYL